MSDRFDFEEQIMECWSLCDHLNTLAEGVMEQDMTRDQVTNVLIGLNDLYQLKFNKLFDMFEQGIRDRKIL